MENFRKHNESEVNRWVGVPYDYASVVHYARDAFSAFVGRDTIIPIDEDAEIGQRNGMSETDVWKINRLYNCTNEIQRGRNYRYVTKFNEVGIM